MVGGGRGWLRNAAALQPPERAAMIDRVVDRMAIAVGNYVAGAIAQATIAGITTFIVLSILGVPFAAPLAVVVFFFDLIPLVGATIAAIVVGLVTVFVNFPTATIVWVIWAVIYQQVENNVIQPQIQKRALDIHPFVVLVSVLFGSSLFGVAGALFAIPVAASAQIAVVEWWRFRHERRPGLEPPGEPPAGAAPAPAEGPA
jgi:predicted PurR-regulated permease PerM